MSLSLADVQKVSLLARLRLSDLELEKMTRQLGQVVDYFRQLDEIDTTDIEPMAHALDLHDVFADDEPQASLPRELALATAPKHDGQCYLVPAVLGD
jgi:aspartyl-tRNA(Asn)/glutamyl-tRNA(Gln) amidotransferase subunit C